MPLVLKHAALKISRLLLSAVALFAVALFFTEFVLAQEKEPIAFTGHGAFFDSAGNQVVPTEEFIRKAFAWYRDDLLPRVPAEKRNSYSRQLAAANERLGLTGREQLILESRAVDWLMENAERQSDDFRKQGKLNALRYVLQFELPKNPEDKFGTYTKPIDTRRELLDEMKKFGFGPENITVLSATANFGQLYTTECSQNGVPIPPPIGVMDPAGLTGWKSQGFIPTNELFLQNTVVEVMTFQSSSPEGMCIALPRSNDPTGNQIALDGIICLGKNPSPLSGKSTVCFWDNQKNGTTFTFTKGTQIPIGFIDPSLPPLNPFGFFMSGGVQLTSPGAGMCTDCHAGQNPYIVHPRNPSPQKPFGQSQNTAAETTLGKLNKAPLNLPTFGVTKYDPLVAASWPQNIKSLTDIYAPQACGGCHTGGGGTGGRLPHLSTELPGFCGLVFLQAVQVGTPHSMPQFNPGSAAGEVDVQALMKLSTNPADPGPFDPATFCGMGPTAGPANRGDPHLTTTNDVHFDFQASGEFTALKGEDAPFELQTRQTPVLTSFTPGANPYTGLASCVSLNTAVALQIGKRRVSYQPAGNGGPGERKLELRIDGKLVILKRGSVGLGQGNSISANGGGSLTFGMSDGTKIIVTPNFWSSQGYWYMDIEVIGTSAVAGIMGHIADGEWLPRGGDGSNFGAMSASLSDRFTILNRKFADSWRVTNQTSLFDYPAGMTTRDFTDENWASEGADCSVSKVQAPKAQEGTSRDVAERLCGKIKDKAVREECIFDVMVTGEPGFATLHAKSLKLRGL